MDTTKLVRIRKMAATGTARAIRESVGLSLAEVAQEVGVQRSTVFRWETGRRRPRGEAAIRWLHVLEAHAR